MICEINVQIACFYFLFFKINLKLDFENMAFIEIKSHVSKYGF